MNWLIGQSAIPLLSRINNEVLGNTGIVFDWKKYRQKEHLHEYSEDYEWYNEGTRTAYYKYKHDIEAACCGITIPGKGRVFTIAPIKEFESTHCNQNKLDNGRRFKMDTGFFGSRKIFLDWPLEDNNLDKPHTLRVAKVDDNDIKASTPVNLCQFDERISLTQARNEIIDLLHKCAIIGRCTTKQWNN